MKKLINGAAKLGLNLDVKQIELFQKYYEELTDWNQRINLTSITGYEDVQTKHFLDSLTVVLGWQPRDIDQVTVIDVGSGAGFPGLPLKIAFPRIKLTLLEATAKKTAFLKILIEKLGLDNVDIITGRSEEVAHQPQYREKFDLVLARAVAELAALVELTLPFCKTGGTVIALKKGDISREVSESERAIKLLGGKLREVKEIALPELADERVLVIIDKVSAIPPVYPRRPGMPAKKPIK